MSTRRKNARRIPYRRGRDTRWQVWWPIAVQLIAMMLAIVGLYYGLTQRQAVQAALFDERTTYMKEQIASLQRNLDGIQRYLVELHREERNER